MGTQLAVVAPPQEPWWAILGDAYLCQAAWYRDPANTLYRQVYRKLAGHADNDGHIFILDWMHVSDHGEKNDMTFQEFNDIAGELAPSHVIIPDAWMQAEKNLDMAVSFLEGWTHHEEDFIFVPQGETWDAWLKNLSDAIRYFDKSFTTVGIGKYVKTIAPGNKRTACIPFIRNVNKYVHVLGCNEASEMVHDGNIQSWDTSLPVAAAQYNRLLGFDNAGKWQLAINNGWYANPKHVLQNVNYLKGLLTV